MLHVPPCVFGIYKILLADFDNSIAARSALNQEIDRRFRENGIEIPFSQRDAHVRSADVPFAGVASENPPHPEAVSRPHKEAGQKQKN